MATALLPSAPACVATLAPEVSRVLARCLASPSLDDAPADAPAVLPAPSDRPGPLPPPTRSQRSGLLRGGGERGRPGRACPRLQWAACCVPLLRFAPHPRPPSRRLRAVAPRLQGTGCLPTVLLTGDLARTQNMALKGSSASLSSRHPGPKENPISA